MQERVALLPTQKTLLFLLYIFYNLKQSPALWYKNFFVIFIQLELKLVPEIECLFMNEHLLIFFFVNDIVVIYNLRYKQKTNIFKIKLFQIYRMKSLRELEWFLDIYITRDRNSRYL